MSAPDRGAIFEPVPYVDIVRFAVAMGVLTAAAHVTYLTVRLELLGRFSGTSRHFVWVAPATYAICFALAAVPVLALRRARPWRVHRSGLLGWFIALGAFALLLLVERVHPVAWLVVAGGLGVRVASMSPGTADRWMTRLARAGWVAAVVCGMAGLVRTGWPLLQERRMVDRARIAAPDAPNVLLIIWDTVRAANLSVYDYDRPTTPFLDSLATQGGVVFEHAFSPAAWTLPSHASMMTGRWARHTGTSYLTNMDLTLPTLAERLRAAGYLTAGFMANSGWAGHESGVGKGFVRYQTYRLTAGQLLSSSTLTTLGVSRGIIRGITSASPRHIVEALRAPDFKLGTPGQAQPRSGQEIADLFLAWRERIGDRHPYFAMLNMMEAHWPYAPPPPYRALFGGADAMARYDGGIAYLDAQLARIINALEERGELDRTLVVVTSDHGEMFGEHGLNDHGNSVYLPVMHVPFVVRYPPRFTAGRRTEVVSLRNFAATVLDVTGLAPSLPGTSLVTEDSAATILLHASAGVRQPEHFRTANGPVNGVLNRPWHLITNPDSSLELYQWEEDPAERVDLARSGMADSIVGILRAVERSLLNRP